MESIEYSPGAGVVRMECRIGSMTLSIREARRCLTYLTAEKPHGVLRVNGTSDEVAGFWLDRTLPGHLFVDAAPVTTRRLEEVAVIRDEMGHACTLSRVIVTSVHAQQAA